MKNVAGIICMVICLCIAASCKKDDRDDLPAYTGKFAGSRVWQRMNENTPTGSNPNIFQYGDTTMEVIVNDAEHIRFWHCDLSYAWTNETEVVYNWVPENDEQRAQFTYYRNRDSIAFYYIFWHRSAYNKTIFTTRL